MSATSAPFGLRAINHPSGTVRPDALTNGLASGYANAIYENQPVKLLDTGLLSEVSADTDEFIGTFGGVTYTPNGGRPAVANFWPAATVTQSGSDITVYYTDDPWIEYEVQTDGTVAQTGSVGSGTKFTNLTAGSSLTGLSQCTATSTLVESGNAQLRIIGLSLYPDNAWGDAYVILTCLIGLSQFAGNKAVL